MNKLALITGSTRGVGLSIAKMFLKNHYDIILTGTNLIQTETMAHELSKNTTHKIIPLQLDWTDPQSTRSFLEMIPKFRFQAVVNNAGMLSVQSFDSISVSRYEKMRRVNFEGPIQLTQTVLPFLCPNAHLFYVCPPFTDQYRKAFSLLPYLTTKLSQTLFMEMIANHTLHTQLRVCGIWTAFGLDTDALRFRKIGTEDHYMKPEIISDMIQLLLHEKRSLYHGKVMIDQTYLPNKKIALLDYAIGQKTPKTLEELFLKSMKQDGMNYSDVHDTITIQNSSMKEYSRWKRKNH